MTKKMKEKFDKYWGNGDKINLLLYIAVVLDPRRKMTYLQFCFSTIFGGDVVKVKEMLEKVKNCLSKLYDHYVALNSTNVHASNINETIDMVIDENDPHSLVNSQFNSFLEGQFSSSGSMSELDKYLGDIEKGGKNAQFDILEWWKVNATKYRVLSLIARDVLAMPVSTVASESAFSTGGRILDPFRSSLAPKMVEVLVCAQNWLRSNIPISLRQAVNDIEEFEQQYDSVQLLALETNLFLGGLGFYDQHRDMRLDIDNMSYEELLALEEKMGTVRKEP
ncbi:unnamed protein product [Camellia sinensis]